MFDERNLEGYNLSYDSKLQTQRPKRFFATGSTAGIQPTHACRLRLILGRLNAATETKDMNLPGLRLHELKGSKTGVWTVDVSGNWRVTFRFVGNDAELVNYEDYH